MRHTFISLLLGSLPLLAQNPTPTLSCDDRNSHNDRLVGHCEMKEQTLWAPRGAIHISDVRGNIEFEAANGGVTLQRLAGDVHGRTANGGLNIELAGDRWDGHGMDVTTVNGGVKMDVPSNYSAHFETSTVNGSVSLDLPSVQGRATKEASFDVGRGGATIRVVTTNGGVKIRKG